MAHSHITKALKKGCRLHAFLSGGGLRVVRVERGRNEKLVGYGEHPYIDEALRLANSTLRPIIGRLPRKSRYWTGSATPKDPLDEWMLAGNTFDAWSENNQVVIRLLGYHQDETPEELVREAFERGSARWYTRGGIVLIHGVSFHPKRTEHRYDYRMETIKRCTEDVSYLVARTGYGNNFDEALAHALAAPQLEVEQKKAA